MPSALRFETPENVQVAYEPAGLGTRFVAWFIDQVIVFLGLIVVTLILIAAGVSFGVTLAGVNGNNQEEFQRFMLHVGGIAVMLWSFGSLVYFTIFELLMRGQTPGKRLFEVRVIKASGFQLDAFSILIRNIFRVLDHLPPMYIFPLGSRHCQRAGDMVAGTLVISDAQAELPRVRSQLSQRAAADAQFRFDATQLKRLTEDDYFALERFLDRWPDVPPEHREKLLPMFATRIAAKLKTEAPPPAEQFRFLTDLLAAEIRRQERALV